MRTGIQTGSPKRRRRYFIPSGASNPRGAMLETKSMAGIIYQSASPTSITARVLMTSASQTQIGITDASAAGNTTVNQTLPFGAGVVHYEQDATANVAFTGSTSGTSSVSLNAGVTNSQTITGSNPDRFGPPDLPTITSVAAGTRDYLLNSGSSSPESATLEETVLVTVTPPAPAPSAGVATAGTNFGVGSPSFAVGVVGFTISPVDVAIKAGSSGSFVISPNGETLTMTVDTPVILPADTSTPLHWLVGEGERLVTSINTSVPGATNMESISIQYRLSVV